MLLEKKKNYPRTETEHLEDLGYVLSAVWCLNLPCVKCAEVPRGLWPLLKRKKVGVTQDVEGFASSYIYEVVSIKQYLTVLQGGNT